MTDGVRKSAESVNDAEVENLIRGVPYPAPARDLVAAALHEQPVRFPVLAWCLRGAAVAAAGTLIVFLVSNRTPSHEQSPTAAAKTRIQTLDAEGAEVRARLASAQQQVGRIAQPSPTWRYEESTGLCTPIGMSCPTSLTRRFESLQSRLDALRFQLEETPDPPPGNRPTTQSAPSARRTKRRRYA